MIDKRIGKFYVTMDYASKMETSLRTVLSKLEFVPLRVECLYHKQQFEYIGTSPLFSWVGEGVESPTYDIIYNDETKDIEVKLCKTPT